MIIFELPCEDCVIQNLTFHVSEVVLHPCEEKPILNGNEQACEQVNESDDEVEMTSLEGF